MKKSFSWLLSLVLICSMLIPTLALGEGNFTPGTYQGEGTGFGGALTVEVTVNETEITDVTIKGHGETASISDPAIEKIPAAIVENQSLAIDTVSGATLSSKGIIEAATKALEQAAADISFLQVKKEKETANLEKIEKTADVVIIGAGGAGMSAAVEALKAGSSVIIIEKQPAVGGNTLLAGSAMNAADPEKQKAITMSDAEKARIEQILTLESKDDLMKQWQEILKEEFDAYTTAGSTYLFDSPSLHKIQTYIDGDYVANPALLDIYGDQALEAVDFLTALGANWNEEIQAAVGATWKRSHTPTTDYGSKGASFVLPQAEFVAENGGEVMLDSKADTLILNAEGRCVGVAGTTTAGQAFEVTANQGVIVATGGFGANIEMRQKYNKHWPTLDESIATSNGPQATGDGIVMAETAGANLVGMEWIQLIPTYGKGVFTPYIENQMYVNFNGDRFVAEDERRDVLSKAALEQPEAQFYILSDANTVKDGVTSIGTDVDANLVGNGFVFKADTLEELAEMINVPYENLQASVDQFNKAVTEGNDPFGRSVFDQQFNAGPFYAGLTGPMVHHTMGGIEINENAQVLNTAGEVIPGLYAAGEVAGGIHGSNRLGGNAISDIVVFGRIAGQSAAAEAK